MKIAIIGAGVYGQVYLSYLREIGNFDVICFLDDDNSLIGKRIQNILVLGSTNLLATCKQQGITGVIVPIGNNQVRVRLLSQARSIGLKTPNIIHPTAIISSEAKIGSGVYILPGSIVMPYADIRDYVMVSMGVNIAHHTILHRGTFLSTGVNMGASIDVGELAYVGIGAVVMTGVSSIGTEAMIGAGSVVIRNVPEFTTVAGVPAKPLHK